MSDFSDSICLDWFGVNGFCCQECFNDFVLKNLKVRK